VRKLPAAHCLIIDFDGRVHGPHRYWDFRFEPDEQTSLEQWVECFDATVRDSVRAHLVSDVPFGVFLSGGVDSSLVAGHMRAILGEGIKGFAIGFEEERISELRFAEQVAKQWGFDLVSCVMPDSAALDLPKIVAQYGEPFGDASMIPTFWVCRLARERVPMVLSGDGGDEAFAGYDTYLAWSESWLRPYLSRLKGSPGLRPALRVLSALARRALGHELNDVDMWERFILYLPEAARRSLFRPEYARVVGASCTAFESASHAAKSFDRIGYAQYLDIRTYLPYDILTKVDIASMAHGLEVRTPLIDLKVLDVARRIPAALRVEQREGRLMGKQIPRRALARWFPPAFVDRKKQGFGIPRSAWLRRGGGARALLDEVIEGGALFEFFREPAVRALVRDHDRGRPRDSALWLLLVFGLWREANKRVRFT
jgi:asparagine synthase (glutamine-hydrolysing)